MKDRPSNKQVTTWTSSTKVATAGRTNLIRTNDVLEKRGIRTPHAQNKWAGVCA